MILLVDGSDLLYKKIHNHHDRSNKPTDKPSPNSENKPIQNLILDHCSDAEEGSIKRAEYTKHAGNDCSVLSAFRDLIGLKLNLRQTSTYKSGLNKYCEQEHRKDLSQKASSFNSHAAKPSWKKLEAEEAT